MLQLLSDAGPVWLAVVPGVLALAIWAFVDLQRFVLFAVLGAMIIPTGLLRPGGTEIALADILLVFALSAWLVSGSVGAAPAPWLRGNPMLAATLLFVAVNMQSLAWSVRPRDTLLFSLQLIEIVVVLPLVFASLPRSLSAIRRGLVIYIALACILAVITVISYAPSAAAGNLEGQYLPFGFHKNAIGSFLAAGLVLAYVFWIAEPRGRAKRLLAAAVLVEGAGLFATVSRGSIIGALVAVIAASFLLRRQRVLILATTLLAVTAFLLIFGLQSGVDRSVSGSYDSSVVRDYSFRNATEKIRARPLLGTGAGTYLDYIPQLDIGLEDPNNMFLLTWAELGVAGVVALLVLLGRFTQLLVASRRLPGEAGILAVASGCVTLSLFVHVQLDITWTRGTTSLAFATMGLMMAARRLSVVSTTTNIALAPRPLPAAGLAGRNVEAV